MASPAKGAEETHHSQRFNATLRENSASIKNGPSLERVPNRDDIQGLDWEQLQEAYVNAMQEHGKAEEEVNDQTADLLKIFMAWSQTTLVRDETRALKRFKTQMQHVKNSEEILENKKRHYTNVVQAFQSALALLNGRLNP
ncbi:hypothetical protein BDV59DRAFT_189317 [Aspergillus ambiguus]|uniref:uncharacterized protein n=1 Tax=Aspergillus ambiguus TaxID=176160 RepID=UPI003CCDCDB7